MRYLILAIIALTIAIFSFPAQVQADTVIAGHSAQLNNLSVSNDSDLLDAKIKAQAIKNVLASYNSPLVSEAETFVTVSRALELEPYMLVSIAGVESGFAARYIKNTHNVFGYGVGKIRFDNFADGIARVGYALRYRYIDSGAETLAQIGHIYAGGSTTWAGKVNSFMSKFEQEEERIRRLQLLQS